MERKRALIAELLAVPTVAIIVIAVGLPFVGENPIAYQGLIWVANVMMLVTVWLGLRLRGQGWDHFGLSWGFGGARSLLRTALLSVVVFVAAVAAFIVGAIVMANIVGIPEGADTSGYNYLQGNLPMLLLSLAGVYVVSSFGEEVIYRGFLINRIAELGEGGKWAWWWAVLVSAVVFGLVHFAWGPAGIVQTVFMGLALGAAYLLLKRNLWVMILAHAYMDTILMLQMYLGPGPVG
jgi:membrane protease YdiL (CAAX protease family)